MSESDRWAALEVRHLRAFVAVARERSFVRAARVLGYSQPGVSQQILALERLVGTPLLVRSAGGRSPLKLTEAGVVFLEHARELLARVSLTHADVERLVSLGPGPLSLLTIQSLGVRVLPSVLQQFRQEHPSLPVRVKAITSAEASWAAVESGEVDLALTMAPMVAGPFEVRPILAEPFVLLTDKTRPVHRLEELDSRRLLLTNCRTSAVIEERLFAEGISPAATDRFDDVGLIQMLVAAGEGVAIVPDLSVDRRHPDVAVRALPEVPPRQLVSLRLRERPLTGPIARLLRLVGDACASLAFAEPTSG